MYYYLIYISYETHPLAEVDLVHLLREARKRNEEIEVTGMLVYLDGKFLQILEGDKEVVRELYDKIAQDDRHQKPSIILEGNIEKRNFENWSMGFAHISYETLLRETGLKDLEGFFKQQHIEDTSHPALIFLKLFYKKNRPDFEIQ